MVSCHDDSDQCCRSPPLGFDAKLSEAYPDLYQKLKEVKDSCTCKLHFEPFPF